MKPIIIAFTLFFTVNLFAQNDPVDTPKIALKVGIDKIISLKNHTITFVEVLEDSRCPEYVNCIWAGRARIRVEIKDNSNNVKQKELLFGQTKPGELIDNTLFIDEESKVNGLTLSPYPNSEKETDPKSYRLLIEVEKKVD
jgi:hypothetical protein